MDNGLKGQYSLAQGKRHRSVALGCGTSGEIVRAMAFFKGLLLFRTKRHESSSFSGIRESQLRPQEVSCSDHHVSADVLLLSFFYPGRCPGLNYADLSGLGICKTVYLEK